MAEHVEEAPVSTALDGSTPGPTGAAEPNPTPGLMDVEGENPTPGLMEATPSGLVGVAEDCTPSGVVEGGVSSAVLSNGGGAAGHDDVEMATIATGGDVVSDAGSLAVQATSLQEPTVAFVMKDVTDSDWQKSCYTYSLSHSSAVVDLYAAIAKEAGRILHCACVCACTCVQWQCVYVCAYGVRPQCVRPQCYPTGYEEDSFLLAWDNKDSDDPDTATPLSPKSTQTLFELDMPSEPAKCYLFLRDGPDGPPIKLSTVSSQGEGQGVEPASSISTTTSSHALNNASNNAPNPSHSSNSSNAWASTPHYSNKSDTGELIVPPRRLG